MVLTVSSDVNSSNWIAAAIINADWGIDNLRRHAATAAIAADSVRPNNIVQVPMRTSGSSRIDRMAQAAEIGPSAVSVLRR